MLRASKSSSTKSLQSKFATAARTAEAYQAQKMYQDYNDGTISPQEYESFVDDKLANSTPGTKDYLNWQNKKDLVTDDLAEFRIKNAVQTGEARPQDYADWMKMYRLPKLNTDSPEYARIVSSIQSAEEAQIGLETQFVRQQYEAMQEEDPRAADQMLLEHYAGLPARYENPIKKAQAQNDLILLQTQTKKNAIKYDIRDMANKAAMMGTDTLGKAQLKYDTYKDLRKQALENGLYDVAQGLETSMFNAETALQRAIESENNRASAAAGKALSQEDKDFNNFMDLKIRTVDSPIVLQKELDQALYGGYDYDGDGKIDHGSRINYLNKAKAEAERKAAKNGGDWTQEISEELRDEIVSYQLISGDEKDLGITPEEKKRVLMQMSTKDGIAGSMAKNKLVNSNEGYYARTETGPKFVTKNTVNNSGNYMYLPNGQVVETYQIGASVDKDGNMVANTDKKNSPKYFYINGKIAYVNPSAQKQLGQQDFVLASPGESAEEALSKMNPSFLKTFWKQSKEDLTSTKESMNTIKLGMDTIKNEAQPAVDAVKQGLAKAGDYRDSLIAQGDQALGNAADVVVDKTKELAQGATDVVQNLENTVTDKGRQVISKIKEAPQMVQNIANSADIQGELNKILAVIPKNGEEAKKKLADGVKSFWDQTLYGIPSALVDQVKAANQPIVDNWYAEQTKKVDDQIKQSLQETAKSGADMVKAAANSIVNPVKNTWNSVVNAKPGEASWQGVVGDAADWAGKTYNSAKQKVTGAVQKGVGWIKSKF